MSLRLGLCCQFLDEPIRFRAATHRYVSGLDRKAARAYLGGIAMDNALALEAAVGACHDRGIGAFRINSAILPLATHPASGYRLEEVDPAGEAHGVFRRAGALARRLDIRLSFHPDQFVVLNSSRDDVVESSLREIEHQAWVGELVGADTIVVHGGSTAGGTGPALDRLARSVDLLSARARSRLALENDDRCYPPATLLPLCERLDLPFVYDVHHHRCLPDGLSVADATDQAVATWGGREPYAHLSSPREGWGSSNPRPHAGLVDPADFPDEWRDRTLTVDVEAKEKERAVAALLKALARPPGRGGSAGSARRSRPRSRARR